MGPGGKGLHVLSVAQAERSNIDTTSTKPTRTIGEAYEIGSRPVTELKRNFLAGERVWLQVAGVETPRADQGWWELVERGSFWEASCWT